MTTISDFRMEIQQRRAINDKLAKYCYCAKEDDFIEITEWTNGEGIDVLISSNGTDKTISLTHGEIDAIMYLKMSLDYQR